MASELAQPLQRQILSQLKGRVQTEEDEIRDIEGLGGDSAATEEAQGSAKKPKKRPAPRPIASPGGTGHNRE
eukprot:4839641-Pyramimonas_sp.AAC.1